MELLPLEEPSLVPPVFLWHVAPVLQDSALVVQDVALVVQDAALVVLDVALVLQDSAPVRQDMALEPQDMTLEPQDMPLVLQDMPLEPQDMALEPQDTARVPVGSPRQGRASHGAWGRWGWGCCWWPRRQRAADREERKRRVRWGRQCQVEPPQVPIPPEVPPLVQWNNTVPTVFKDMDTYREAVCHSPKMKNKGHLGLFFNFF